VGRQLAIEAEKLLLLLRQLLQEENNGQSNDHRNAMTSIKRWRRTLMSILLRLAGCIMKQDKLSSVKDVTDGGGAREPKEEEKDGKQISWRGSAEQ